MLACGCGGVGEIWILSAVVAFIASWFGYKKANEEEETN